MFGNAGVERCLEMQAFKHFYRTQRKTPESLAQGV